VRDAVIERAEAAGVERILVPGWDLPSSDAALELAARRPGLLQAAVGVHPHHAVEPGEADWARLEALAADPRCVAVGEIGLDFFRNLSPPDRQRAAFERQLELATRLDRPVLVHDRDAHEAITSALLAWPGREAAAVRGVLHAFSGDALMAERLATAGFAVSFALPVSFRSASGPRGAAATVPADALLLETDGPYLGPAPDRLNEPTTVLRVAAELARLRESTAEDVAVAARRTYERLVG
jgi:TatD DNase family protein